MKEKKVAFLKKLKIFKFLQTAGFQSPTSAMLFANIMTPLMTYTKSFTGVFIRKI